MCYGQIIALVPTHVMSSGECLKLQLLFTPHTGGWPLAAIPICVWGAHHAPTPRSRGMVQMPFVGCTKTIRLFAFDVLHYPQKMWPHTRCIPDCAPLCWPPQGGVCGGPHHTPPVRLHLRNSMGCQGLHVTLIGSWSLLSIWQSFPLSQMCSLDSGFNSATEGGIGLSLGILLEKRFSHRVD